LAGIVEDDMYPDAEISWEVTGNEQLRAHFLNGSLEVSSPDSSWSGSEALKLEACDPEGLCSFIEVTFTVLSVNDPPVLTDIGEHVVLFGEAFPVLNLGDYVYDEETLDENLSWSVVQNESGLIVELDGRHATLTPPDDAWRGPGTIQFQVCDHEEVCGIVEGVFTKQEDSNVRITFVSNAGFLIEGHGKKILIDVPHQDIDLLTVPVSDRRSIENADAPYDDVDLLLFTHEHEDHFDLASVASHLENNPHAVLVSTQNVVELMLSGYHGAHDFQDRMIPVDVKNGEFLTVTVNGINLGLSLLPHGAPVINAGVLIHLGGFRIFHTGDFYIEDPEEAIALLQTLELPEKRIDIALVSHYFVHITKYNAVVSEGINPTVIIPMHFNDISQDSIDKIEASFPSAIFLHREPKSQEFWLSDLRSSE
jgi:L-ascorbate metabolism protein UlaG (beta-lactamase superfamily)